MLGTIMPSPRFTAWDDAGDPIPGALLRTYAAGTTTNVVTWFDEDLATIHQNANPVVCDSAGRCVVYLSPGTSYKFRLETALGVLVWEQDHITAGPFFSGTDIAGTAGEALAAGTVVYLSDGSGGKTAGRWYLGDNTNGYSSTLPTIGMVQTAIASGGVGVIRISGTVTGLAGLVVGTTYYVGLAGALTATLPALARAVGVADTTTSIVLNANPASLASNAPIVQRSILVGSQNDVALLPGVAVLYLDGASAIFVSGFAAGIDGQRVLVINRTGGTVPSRFSNQDSGSALANRLITQAGSLLAGAVSSFAAGAGWFEMVYDATAARWRMVASDSGWISAGWTAVHFSGNGLMTWDVEIGDLGTSRYRLTGRTLQYAFSISTSTIGGVANLLLQISSAQWGSHIVAGATFQQALAFANDGAVKAAYIRASAGGVQLEIVTAAATNWDVAGTNDGYFAGTITFEVA